MIVSGQDPTPTSTPIPTPTPSPDCLWPHAGLYSLLDIVLVCFLSLHFCQCLFAGWTYTMFSQYSDPVCDAQPVFRLNFSFYYIIGVGSLQFVSSFLSMLIWWKIKFSDPVCDPQPVCPDCDKVVSVIIIIKTDHHHHHHHHHHHRRCHHHHHRRCHHHHHHHYDQKSGINDLIIKGGGQKK